MSSTIMEIFIVLGDGDGRSSGVLEARKTSNWGRKPLRHLDRRRSHCALTHVLWLQFGVKAVGLEYESRRPDVRNPLAGGVYIYGGRE